MDGFIKNTLLKPLLERLGTVTGVSILWAGDWVCTHWSVCGLVTEDGATQVAKWLVALALVLVDLTPGALRWLRSRR